MTPEQEALREKVARVICATPDGYDIDKLSPDGEARKNMDRAADAAIAVVLKEAAKVAETCRKGGPLKPVAGEILVGWAQGDARDAAAAIRAMIP